MKYIWDYYTRLQVVASAEKEYNDSLEDNLLGATQSNKWWSTLKSALFGVDMTIPALLKPDGSLTHDPKEKATLFADVFDRKQINDKLTMPQTCFPEAKMTSLAFRPHEIRNLLNDLDESKLRGVPLLVYGSGRSPC